MNVFVLEDEIDGYRSPMKQILSTHHVTYATSCDEGKALFDMSVTYDLLLLDHDMRGEYDPSSHPNCGYQFLLWVFEHGGLKGRPKIFLHSQNFRGRGEMRTLLRTHGHDAEEIPFSYRYLNRLQEYVSDTTKGA